jgi:hypothetical protein
LKRERIAVCFFPRLFEEGLELLDLSVGRRSAEFAGQHFSSAEVKRLLAVRIFQVFREGEPS